MTNVRATTTGRWRGVEDHGCTRYLGIRFGAPPTGSLRFRPPEPAGPCRGDQDASKSGPAAPQLEDPAWPMPPRTSEDCLFLDIYTPSPDALARPVMVWLHGGAFRGGWAGSYDGSLLATEQDVVVVTVGYRLGVLGFLALDHVAAEFAGSANLGIQDQIAGLQWVRANIHLFGGDPDKVTIFGHSAGGESVAALLAAPLADGLYRRAIIQSATVDIPRLGFQHQQLAARVATEAGAGGDGQPDLGALQLAPLEDLLRAQRVVTLPASAGHRITAPQEVAIFPCIDGTVIRSEPASAVAAHGRQGPAVVIGTTRHEGTLLDEHVAADEPDLETVREALTGAGVDAERGLATYRELRPLGTHREVLVDALTDRLVRVGSLRLAEAATLAGGAWVYQVNWETNAYGGRLGAAHAIDLPFLWGWEDRPRWREFLGTSPRPPRLGARLREAWAAFAWSGRPEVEGVTSWPPYDRRTRPTLVIDADLTIVADPDRERRVLWEDAVSRSLP